MGKFEQLLAGSALLVKKRKYRELDFRLRVVVSTFVSSNMFDYLRAVARNFTF